MKKITEVVYSLEYEHIEAAIANYLFSLRMIPLDSEIEFVKIRLPKKGTKTEITLGLLETKNED